MNELISKNQSLIGWKEDFKDFVEGLDIPRDDYKGIMEYIDEVPSAEPETKRAVWALHTYMPHHHYCTHCKKDSPYNKRWSYCPNCGYEMEEYV